MMIIEAEHSQMQISRIHTLDPFVAEKHGDLHFKMILFCVALVTVVWVGVVAFFAVELFRRAFS